MTYTEVNLIDTIENLTGGAITALTRSNSSMSSPSSTPAVPKRWTGCCRAWPSRRP